MANTAAKVDLKDLSTTELRDIREDLIAAGDAIEKVINNRKTVSVLTPATVVLYQDSLNALQVKISLVEMEIDNR